MSDTLTLIFDLDGTLCPIKKENEIYEDLIPYPEMVNKLRQYHTQGAKIVLFTSRNMNSYGNNLGMINAHTAKVLLTWLEKWDIPYDEILYGKPWPGNWGFYIDDRTVRPDEFLQLSIEEMEQRCQESKARLGE